ncbi:MAG: glycoside hydrolase family 13 protein [Anaerolineales bacterium]|nr:glycoside hydrolase family 13 protein [Anaerolineales bacterium]
MFQITKKHILITTSLLALVAMLLAVFSTTALASLGWVGGMWPAGGSTNNLTEPASFNVFVQVYKNGVTEPDGPGAGITCTLRWAPVGFFGGTWGAAVDTPMVYNTDIGNNDEYMATITQVDGLTVGLYEYTALCTDTSDDPDTFLEQTDGYGRIKVDAASGGCNGASQGDNNVYYNGLFHDSFSASYRSPTGPVTDSQGAVTLKFRTCMDDLTSRPVARVWNDRTDVESFFDLNFDSHGSDASLGGVTYWSVDLPIPTDPTILYYVFRASEGSATGYYRDDDPKFYGGGFGTSESDQTTAYNNSYQLTVYDDSFSVPGWMRSAVVYQIFPERFRDGSAGNNPTAGRFFYNEAGGSIVRSNAAPSDWNVQMCDPRSLYTPSCAGKYSDNFYGGDLAGITQKIEQGYFDNLGVSVLYLNPIFRSPSNHKYDTADYLVIDPDFGALSDFQALVAAAEAHNIEIILDGVFNHTSSDSMYFDRYFRYDSSGNLISPSGIGTDDDSGGCEAAAAPFYSWFYFPDTGNPGKDNGVTVYCNNDTPQTYEAWYGYSSLPKLQANITAVRDLIWDNGLSSVGPYWTEQGAAGWRFDVGADVDPGLTSPYNNTYWEGFRAAVRDGGVTGRTDTLLLGEEWGDSSAWLLGNEWDSVMNYRFRSALLSWLFTGCSGSGCTGGTVFQENDSNSASSSGAISYLSPSQFNARLRSIQEDYPPMAFQAMMNLDGSHDTNRVRFLLKKVNNDNDAAAVQRMKEWWLFAYTYPGAPTLYYGDEIGLHQDGVYDSSTWQDDPYNRVPFPWPDASGSYYGYGSGSDTSSNAYNTNLQGFARHMASLRWSYPALQDGDVQHGLVIDDANKLYGYARTNGSQTALILLNRDSAAHSATFSGLNAAPYNLSDGTLLKDGISGTTYTVSGGQVTVSVTPTWGAVLLEWDKIETPAAISGLVATIAGSDRTLKWTAVSADTTLTREVAVSYTIHRSTSPSFTPDVSNQIGTASPPAYGSPFNQVTYVDAGSVDGSTYYYSICSLNAAGKTNCSAPSLPTAVMISGFAILPLSDGAMIQWQTMLELDLIGFNLYRSTSLDGPRQRLNVEVIECQQLGEPFGAAYAFLDEGIQPGVHYYYWLEWVNGSGYTILAGQAQFQQSLLYLPLALR